MAFCVTTDEYGIKVYRREFKSDKGLYYNIYSTDLNSKNSKGEKKKSFIQLRFKKNEVVEDGATIIVKKGFLSFNANLEPSERVPYVFVTDYEIIKGEEFDSIKEISDDNPTWL